LRWFRDRFWRSAGLPPGRVLLESSLIDDLGADSLDVVELLAELEDEFEVAFPDEVAVRFRTVGDVIRYINRQRGEEAA
jgi:acyl carrier protein